jgi:hypothetical protein
MPTHTTHCGGALAPIQEETAFWSVFDHGNEPTFVVCSRIEVTGLTLVTNKIGNLVSNWDIFNEPPFSRHRYIYASK